MMRRSAPIALALLGLVVAVWLRAGVRLQADAQAPAPAAQASAADPGAPRAVLDKYCVTCHNQRLKTAGLALDTLDPARVGEHVDVWEKAVRKLHAREMPPPGAARPDAATLDATVAWLERALDAHALAAPNPGRVAVHRLNRAEYTNAIRDLLGLELDPRALLFSDEPDQQSFDNLASVLSVSPALLENYLSAAYRVSRLAVADPKTTPVVETYAVPLAMVQDERVSDDLPFGSQGGVAIRHHFPADGEYAFTVTLRRQLYLYIVGMGEPHDLDVRVDGARVARFTVGGAAKGRTMPESFAGNTQGDPEFEVYMHTADANLKVRVPVTAGSHDVGVSFVRRFWTPEGVLQPPQRGFARTTNELYHGNPAVDSVAIAGPYPPAPAAASGREPSARPVAASRPNAAASGRSDSPSRKKVFICRPGSRAEEEPCARRILSALATRAYRRPVTDADLTTLLEFYRGGRAEGDFETGIQQGIERILAAPSFIFRVVRAPASAAAGAPYRLSDLDLASRLSFFLWSSIPDDELLSAAGKGTLSQPAELRRQARRMLADSRSAALVNGFAMQWLKLGKIAGVVPDVDAFPEFDENLRRAMLEETRAFVSSQLREDRSVVELVTANHTYMNERLARHYRVPNVYGDHFRRVAFEDGMRGGLLGQASIMTATSYPNRTSPVLRGKWLLENMLGSPPPAPPADVPSLDESASKTRPQTMREQMEAHRRNPSCAVCHVRMDPLGFSLENFDALGQWRTATEAGPIDATAGLPDGSTIQGVAGLKALMSSHREDFVRTFTEKLLAYALGRGLEPYDLPTVRAIARETGGMDHRWSAIIEAIVASTPFRMTMVTPGTQAPAAAASASASR